MKEGMVTGVKCHCMDEEEGWKIFLFVYEFGNLSDFLKIFQWSIKPQI